MSDADPSNGPEELSPESRAVMARARRSFMVSIGVLLVGLIAVLGVFVYRASQSGDAGSEYTIASLPVPAGAEIVSAVAADGKLTVTLRLGPVTTVRIYDGKNGALIREVPVLSE